MSVDSDIAGLGLLPDAIELDIALEDSEPVYRVFRIVVLGP